MKTVLALLFIGAVFATPAHAAVPGAEACKADAEKLCPGAKPGSGAIVQCLKQHQAELSPACIEFRDKVKDKIIAFMQACGADIKTHCNGVQPGGGRVMQCLKQNQSALSAECQAQLTFAR